MFDIGSLVGLPFTVCTRQTMACILIDTVCLCMFKCTTAQQKSLYTVQYTVHTRNKNIWKLNWRRQPMISSIHFFFAQLCIAFRIQSILFRRCKGISMAMDRMQRYAPTLFRHDNYNKWLFDRSFDSHIFAFFTSSNRLLAVPTLIFKFFYKCMTHRAHNKNRTEQKEQIDRCRCLQAQRRRRRLQFQSFCCWTLFITCVRYSDRFLMGNRTQHTHK